MTRVPSHLTNSNVMATAALLLCALGMLLALPALATASEILRPNGQASNEWTKVISNGNLGSGPNSNYVDEVVLAPSVPPGAESPVLSDQQDYLKATNASQITNMELVNPSAAPSVDSMVHFYAWTGNNTRLRLEVTWRGSPTSTYKVKAMKTILAGQAKGWHQLQVPTPQSLFAAENMRLKFTSLAADGGCGCNTRVYAAYVDYNSVTPPSYAPTSSIEQVPTSAKYVSPTGSSSGSGTQSSPYSLAHAISIAQPGNTFVLLPGTYAPANNGPNPNTTAMNNTSGTAAAPITWRGAPNEEMPVITGQFQITGSHQRFNYLLFDGPTGPVNGEEQNVINVCCSDTQGVEISDSEIRESAWHAGIFLSGDAVDDGGTGNIDDGAQSAKITGNYIHDNGDFNNPEPLHANGDHGIYFSRGSGLIANNVIEHNVARGIQLYSSSSPSIAPYEVTIANNTIVGNEKAGVTLANATANSDIANNIVAYNAEHGIRGLNLSGSGNQVKNNLSWGNTIDPSEANSFYQLSSSIVSISDNLKAYPGFDVDQNYRPPLDSPALNNGLAEFAPVIDFDLNPRPLNGYPDIGAFETG